MKRFFLLVSMISIFSTSLFCQTKNDATEDNQEQIIYKMNDAGDQYIKIGVMPNFPLNFGKQLYVGGAAYLGYYRYINSWLALGGELMAGYNPTLGSNILTFVPITFGASFLPSVWKFEFPITLSTGFAFETCSNKKYFPGFVLKAEAGVFYRISEGWSVGVGADFLTLPQVATYKGKKTTDNGLFLTAFATARYHF